MEKKEEKGIFEKTYNWFASLTVKGLLGAILMAFVILIIISSVSYLPAIMGRISSSLSAALYSVFIPADNATMTADKTIVNTGEDFTVSFKKTDTMNGLFTISYACDSGATLQSVETAGLKIINCDKPYYLLDNTSIKIRPFTKDSVVRLVIQGSFENTETDQTDKVGVVRIIIKNNSVGVMVSTSSVSTTNTSNTVTNNSGANTYSPSTYQPNYNAKPDLAIRQLQIGLLNNANNLITNQTQFSASNMVGIKFEIRNDGDADTGPWVFTASLPSNSTPVYNSATQISLKPGESIIFTLGFSNLTNQYNDLITIKADPLNGVSECNEYNNTLTSTITNTSYNSGYYMNNTTNGCYINGVFTYNCNNNGGWNNNYNNNSNTNLSISCYASENNPKIGQAMNWYPSVSGGNGSYSYYWSGTDSLSSYSQYPNMTYYTSGYKTANLTVTSGGYTRTVTCSTNVGGNNNNSNNANGYYDSYGNYIYYNNNNNSNGTLSVTCYANPSNPRTGNRVYWYASAFGGNGNYTYSWDGTDGLNSSSQNPGIVYNSSGNKDAIVTVQSGGYYVSHNCSTYVSY